MKSDFMWLDTSTKATSSMPSPSGVGGGGSEIGGIGPMLVRAKSGEYLLDPHGVFLAPGEGQPLFRVLAVQKFKTLGVRLVGCFEGTDVDVLQDRRNGHKVVLTEEGDPGKSILVLATQPVPGNMLPVTRAIRKMVRDVLCALDFYKLRNSLIYMLSYLLMASTAH